MKRYTIDMARKIPGAKIAAEGIDVGYKGTWVLKHRFAHRDDPKLFETLQKIRDAGSIDLTLWRRPYKGEC